jgi:hypothetical protein
MTMTQGLTLTKIDELIKLNEARSDEMHEERKHKDVYSDPFDKEVRRLKTLRVLVESGVQFKLDNSGGAAVVEERFVFTLISHKWRNVGKNVWYRSNGASDFIKRFVRG